MNAPANRGKYAEGKVRDFLALLDAADSSFTFNRVQDAHAAGGRFTPQAGDFQAFRRDDRMAFLFAHDGGMQGKVRQDEHPRMYTLRRNFIFEVKELKHNFRLPHASYSPDKVARVQKRVLAGTEALVLLYHSEVKQWRAVPFDVFTTRTGGSWDLSAHPVGDFKAAMREFMGMS